MPKPVRVTSRLSYIATRIFPSRRQSSGEILKGAQATALFWRREDMLCLVTNWHNVTGWDAANERALSDVAFTPDVIAIDLAFRKQGDHELLARKTVYVDLYEDDSPRWREHPTHGRKVDVVAIDVGSIDVPLFTLPVNSYDEFVDFEPVVGDDAVVIGYPLGLTGGSGFPIWKRASIATEPEIDLDGLPKVLIDTATRKGMSGSPVLAVRKGIARPRGGTGQLSGDDVLGTSETFLGVYSGRVDDDPLGAQIGIVWKAAAVAETVLYGLRGSTPHGDP